MHTFTNRLRSFLSPTRSIESAQPLSSTNDSTNGEHPLFKPNAGELIPEELFPLILYFVSTDDTRRQVDDYFLQQATNPATYDPTARDIALLKASPEYTLKSCSLVCLYWAEQCRRYIFTGKTLRVTSYRQAKAVRHYAMRGSARLTPVVTFIKTVDVEMDVSWGRNGMGQSEERPFLGLVYLPWTKDKLRKISVKGPFPRQGAFSYGGGSSNDSKKSSSFPAQPSACYHNPHACPVVLAHRVPQTVTDYARLALQNLAFPSLAHALAYIRHFRFAQEVYLKAITWDTDVVATNGGAALEVGLGTENSNIYKSGNEVISPRWLQHSSRTKLASNANLNPVRLLSTTTRDCTDPIFLAMHTALTLHPTFPLRLVPEIDQVWAMGVYRMLYEFCRGTMPLEGNIHASWGHEASDANTTRSGGCCFKHYDHADPLAQLSSSLSFSLQGFKFSAAHPETRVHLICAPRAPKPNRSSWGPIRVVGVQIVIWASPSPSTSNNHPSILRAEAKAPQKTVDFTALRHTIVEEMCAVRVLIFAFGEYETLQGVVGVHNALRKPIMTADGGGGRRCVLTCRVRQEEWIGEQRELGYARGPTKWVVIDPETLRPVFDDPYQQWNTELEILPALLDSSSNRP